jgi:hypothetical protein
MTLRFVATRPSAFLPIGMSLAALVILVVALVSGWGVPADGDEGAAAHLWQLLIFAQLPLVAFFAIQWVPRSPRLAIYVLTIQMAAAFASALPVFLLDL